MGTNTNAHAHAHAYSDTNAHTDSHAYPDSHTNSYSHSYTYAYTSTYFQHNIDQAYNINGDPVNHFDQLYQFISTIIFITAGYHILNHHHPTLSD